MASSYDLQAGYVIAEKYRVVKQLGEGGMGQVYLVQHVKTDERFALKILNPDVAKTPSARERFRREARTPARIDSDHVARVVDTDIAEDLEEAPFLVMEYLRGENLQDLSDDVGALPPAEVLVYLRQIALALDRAHAIGIVHRDLKPENLFLTTRDDGTPNVKVLDFGIAKLSGATGDLAKIKATATGDIFGTPMYMSPEQCLSEAEKISAQSDIWAFGLIAYRLLVGTDFWTANTLTHLIAQIAYEPIPVPSTRAADFGPAFDEWFARCCHRDVTQRYGTAGEAVAALGEVFGEEAPARVSHRGLAALRAGASEPPSGSGTSSDDLASAQTMASGGLLKTSEALTLDTIDPASRGETGSRMPLLVVGGLGLMLLGGALAWVASTGSPDAGPPMQAGPGETASEPAETSQPSLEPSPAPSLEPTSEPSTEPTAEATASASAKPTAEPTSTAGAGPQAPPVVPRPRPQAQPPPPPPPPPPSGGNPLDRRH